MERNAGEFIHAIPQTSRNTIAYLVEMIMVNVDFYELTDLFLSTLTVTEVSLVAHLLGISNNFLDFEKYMNPLREIDPTMRLMDTVVQERCRVLILGDGVPALVEMIRSPTSFWARHLEKNSRNLPVHQICIVSIKPSMQGHMRLVELWCAHRDVTEAGVNDRGLDRSVLVPTCDDWQERTMCSIGGTCFAMKWEDIYENASNSSVLPYIEIAKASYTLNHSELCKTMAIKTDTVMDNSQLVLWKRNYCLPPNYHFTGRIHMEGGVFMDEIAYAFIF